MRLLWLLAWWPMAGLAAPPPPSTSDAVPAGPTEVMLLFGDVNATVVVAGKETRVPANLELPVGTHEARITTSSGQLVVKVVEVARIPVPEPPWNDVAAAARAVAAGEDRSILEAAVAQAYLKAGGK